MAADAKYVNLHEAAPRTIYLNAFQEGRIGSQFALRTSGAPAAVTGDVRRAVRDVLKTVRIAKVTTMNDQVDASIIPERLIATLSGFFGGLGALLAAIGLYGLLAYTVARRTNEIGIRMALGATERDVTRMVLKSALGLVCAGLAVGAPIAVWSKRLAASMMASVAAVAAETRSAVRRVPNRLRRAAMITVALLAAYVPRGGRRAWIPWKPCVVGTRKGAFVLTSDGKREKWDVSGPHFAGWEIYHLKGSPVDPNRLYASQSSGWFGQLIQRSNDGGKTWEPVGNKFVYDGVPGTHQWYDGTPHPWEFKRVWHLEPSLTDPDTVYAGVEDAALFRSTDGGQTWQELSGLRGHGSGRLGSRAPAGCACTRSFSIRAIPTGSSSPSRRRARSAPTMAARRGSRSTAD